MNVSVKSLHLPLIASQNEQDVTVPPPNAALDCIVVGYNDIDFDGFARAQKTMARTSGAYLEARTSSVRLDGKRLTYMDLLNHVLKKARGVDPRLSTFNSPNLGACHIAHYLRKRGYTVEIDNLFQTESAKFAKLLEGSPNAVAITTTYYTDPDPSPSSCASSESALPAPRSSSAVHS
jgi:hypothetical protein